MTLKKGSDEYNRIIKNMSLPMFRKMVKELKIVENFINTKEKKTAGDLLEIYVASMLTGKNYELSRTQNTLGKRDGGIDVFYFENDTLNLIQVKLKDYEDNYIRKMMNTYNDFIEQYRVELNNDNKDIEKIRKKYEKSSVERVKYIFIGTDEVDPNSIKDKFKGKNVEVYSIEQFLTNAATGEYDENFRSNFKFKLWQRAEIKGGKKIEKDSEFIFSKGDDFIDQFMKLHDFAIDSLFNKNIRSKVSKKPFLESFKFTLKNYPQHFHLFNNGVTIISSDFKTKTSFIEIEKPQIINGQQTVRALIELKRQGWKLDNIEVPIKIIRSTDPEITGLIARFSNNQSAVKENELTYISDEYKTLVELSNKNGYSLKGKKGSSSKSEILKLSIQNGELPLNELIRAHAAIYKPQDFLGDSKNKITSVVKKYMDDGYIDQLLKENTFKNMIKIINEYNEYYNLRVNSVKQREQSNGLKAAEANKIATQNTKHLKFGISVFYNLLSRNKDPEDIEKCVLLMMKNYDETINVFKSNVESYKHLNKALKELKI